MHVCLPAHYHAQTRARMAMTATAAMESQPVRINRGSRSRLGSAVTLLEALLHTSEFLGQAAVQRRELGIISL
jgi:hypothetical protein